MFSFFKKEKRQQYRVEAEKPPLFNVSMVLPEGRLLPGSAVDISMDGAAASFPEDQRPELASGDTVTLKIVIENSEKIITADALVRNISREEDREVFHFQFLKQKQFEKHLDTAQRSFFNRRQSFRTGPTDTDAPVEITAGWDEGMIQCILFDISLSGIGLGMSEEMVAQLGDTGRLRIQFTLPGQKEKLLMAGKVQFKRYLEEEKLFLVGLNFEQNIYNDNRREEAAIASYITRQQLKILQARVKVKYGE